MYNKVVELPIYIVLKDMTWIASSFMISVKQKTDLLIIFFIS